MASDSQGSEILAQQEVDIERLAHDTHSTIARVQEVYLEEHRKLAAGAHITAYLPLLTGNLVRIILNEENAPPAKIPQP